MTDLIVPRTQRSCLFQRLVACLAVSDDARRAELEVCLVDPIDLVGVARADLLPGYSFLNRDVETRIRRAEVLARGPSKRDRKAASVEARRVRDLVAIATSAEFRDPWPSQIVPRLADRGEDVASESTFCRVLRGEDMQPTVRRLAVGVGRRRRGPPDPASSVSWEIESLTLAMACAY